jgi:hypothetical protein
VVAGLAPGVHPLFVVVRAEVGVAGVGVRWQDVGGGEDGVSGGDEGFLLGHAPGQPPVPGAEEGLGAASADGGFAEGGAEVGIAAPGEVAALAFPAGTA